MEELILYLESLEMLNMNYKIEKTEIEKDGLFFPLWTIEYHQGQPLNISVDIKFED